MVALMLEDDGGEILDSLAGILQCERRHVGYLDFMKSHDLSPPSRDREASLAAELKAAALAGDTDIRVHLKRLAILVESLDSHHASEQSHLRTCYPDTVLLRRCDSGNHLLCQPVIDIGADIADTEITAGSTQEKRVFLAAYRQDAHHITFGIYQLNLRLCERPEVRMACRGKERRQEQENKTSHYFANATDLVSRMTVIFTCPGYVISSWIF